MLKSLEARVKLEPLLQGRVEVEDINLTNPILNLEVDADGKTNLSGLLKSSADIGAAAGSVQLNKVSITNGMLHYTSKQTGTEKIFDKLNLSVTAQTLLGPYRVQGDMQYQKTKANVDMDTGTFDKNMTAAVHILLAPVSETMPQIKLNGDLSLKSGVDVEGEVSTTQGKFASLVNIPALNALDFMNDDSELTGMVDWKGDKFALNDIRAKFGKGGSLQGKLSVQPPAKTGEKPTVNIDMNGSGLTITAKPSDAYMNVPEEYQGSLRFKGKNFQPAQRQCRAVQEAATQRQR
jgi:uncharacterized protein involved in outer membrane biogenesis